MPNQYPLALQTAYRDLLDRLQRRPEPELSGSVLLAGTGSQKYWVVRRRVGPNVVEQRIGPDTDENRVRAEAIKAQNVALKAWNGETGQIVAQLRAAGLPTPTTGTGKLINALSRSGFFRDGGILAGTNAFALYALELGAPLDDMLIRTEDVDIAADRSVRIIAGENASLTVSLEGIGLNPIAGPLEDHPVRWQTDDGIVLDILAPRRRNGESTVLLKGLGIWAQALPFLEFCLKDPIHAVALYREGIPVRIPAPERFAVHKLIVASVRTGTHRAKSEKDLMQAGSLIQTLVEARPYELQFALEEAQQREPKWRSAIDMSLKRRPEIAELLAELG